MNQRIVVGNDHCIQARLDGCLGDIHVTAAPIGVTGMHVQIKYDLFHFVKTTCSIFHTIG
jgi:hypothetical protein